MSKFAALATGLGTTPWGLGLAGAGAVLGFFGSRKKRKAARKKKAQAKELLGQQFTSLEGAATANTAEFAQRRELQGQGNMLNQQNAVAGYGNQMQGLQNQVAMTGFSGIGSGQDAINQYQNQFAIQQQGAQLGMATSAFDLQMREASSQRDIQSAGFEMDRYAAEKGIKSSYGQTLLDNLGGYSNG